MPQKTKIIVLSVLGLIVIGLASFAVYYKVKSGGKIWPWQKLTQEKIDVQSVPTVDPKFCDRYNSKEKEKNVCLTSVAISANNKEICDMIADEEEKNKCQEMFLFNEITRGEDENKCLGLRTEELKSRCLNDFFWKWDEPEKCARLEGDNKTNCEDIINNKTAYDSGDVKNCAKIKNENLKTDCEATVSKKPKDTDGDGIIDSIEMSYGIDPFKADTDGDGLNDLDELSKYFTNPENSDTDGDGYSDGDEVKSGYNPKGEGKL